MTAEQKCQVCKSILNTQKEILYMEEQIYAIKKDDMTILVRARSPKEAQNKVLEKVCAKQPTIESEPVKPMIEKFRDYQIGWLTAHYDIELCEELESLIIRFLRDTAECFIRETDKV